jgi:hypothetical protein
MWAVAIYRSTAENKSSCPRSAVAVYNTTRRVCEAVSCRRTWAQPDGESGDAA